METNATFYVLVSPSLPKVQNNSKSQEVCMHGYLVNGYPNSLSNFNYKKVEKITSLRPLLDQPWITTKITSNIVKVDVHYYLPNVKINLWSNFNSKKLVKSETLLYSFAEVGLKGGQNSLEHCES